MDPPADENIHLDKSVTLKQAFVADSYEDKDKQRALKDRRKMAWLSERIVIKLLDDKGAEINGCTFQISRRTLTREALQLRVDACPRPCAIDYLYDSTGLAISAEALMLQALPPPAFYVIVPEKIIEPYDVRDYTAYSGQTGTFLKNVPLTCSDRSEEVDEETLSEWVRFTLVEGDVSLLPFQEELERSRGRLKQINRELKGAETRVFFDANNARVEGDWAEKERNLLYSMLGEDRQQEEMVLRQREDELEQQRQRIRHRVKLKFERQGDADPKLEVCSWRMFVYGTEDARQVEDMLMSKQDWSGVRLASHCAARGLPPWSGREPVPVGESAVHADYSGLEVRMSAVQLQRVPHGAGIHRALDRQSSSIAADKFGLFYGQWQQGKRAGRGMAVDDSGVFTGSFESGFRRGAGRMDYGDGSSVTGNFGVNELRRMELLAGFDNPYMEGEPNGIAEVHFADGGIYKGEVVDGLIHGQGEYQSGFGDVMKGTFVNGALEGQGTFARHTGETSEGIFEMGELNGYGVYNDEVGNSYVGEHLMGLMHGRGTAVYAGRGQYSGFHTWGMRSGKGEFEYAPQMKAKAQRSAESETGKKGSKHQKFKNAFHGYLVADRIASGGMLLSADSAVPRSVSQRIETVAKPLDAITASLAKGLQRSRRINEKMSYIERSVRADVSSRKHKIFRQQRHLTKKSMYEDDADGLWEGEIGVRHYNRQGLHEFMSYGPPRVLLPGATLESLAIRDQNLQMVLDDIQPSAQTVLDAGLSSSLQLMQVVVSDVQETAERQRFLKYDKIWARAEAAFIALKADNS